VGNATNPQFTQCFIRPLRLFNVGGMCFMDTTLLRKLSRKSQLKFGIYCDNSVQDLLTFKKYNYLRWVYFNCDMISFLDDILDELSISTDYRINKPGKNPEKYELLFNEKQEKLFGLTKHIKEKKQKKDDRMKHELIERMGSEHFSKNRLRLKNQGSNHL
jgi:hypothetical protein